MNLTIDDLARLCFFIKFFKDEEYADQFIQGSLFANTVGFFKGKEGVEAEGGTFDRDEGTSFLAHGAAITLISGEEEVKDNSGATVQIQMDWLNFVNIFCLYSVKFPEIHPEYTLEKIRNDLLPSQKCTGLGSHSVVITDVKEFSRRVSTASSEGGYALGGRLVRYYDLDSDSIRFRNEIESLFYKPNSYDYQNEYRFLFFKERIEKSSITLDVGSLEDIAVKVPTEDLGGPAFLGNTDVLRKLLESVPEE